jgi:hypothetical protein
MSDRMHPTGGGPFDAVDPKLTVFALANGLDLTKDTTSRRLEWFTDGFERGIVVEAGPSGGFEVHAMCWPTGSEEVRARAAVARCASVEELVRALSAAIDTANGLEPSA